MKSEALKTGWKTCVLVGGGASLFLGGLLWGVTRGELAFPLGDAKIVSQHIFSLELFRFS